MSFRYGFAVATTNGIGMVLIGTFGWSRPTLSDEARRLVNDLLRQTDDLGRHRALDPELDASHARAEAALLLALEEQLASPRLRLV